MGRIGWGGPSTGPILLFFVVVYPCRREPVWAGCCCWGGGGESPSVEARLGVRLGRLRGQPSFSYSRAVFLHYKNGG